MNIEEASVGKLSRKQLRELIRETMQVLNDDALFPHHSDMSISTDDSYEAHDANYMSVSHLMKLQEYANDILAIINMGVKLDDWMESHISQMADDISEVKQALEYKTRS